jgi:hypothetical protein
LPLLLGLFMAAPPASATSLPSVAELLGGSAFTDEDIAAVLDGEIAVTSVQHASDRELAVGLACLVSADADPMAPFDRPRPMLPAEGIEAFERVDPAAPELAFEKFELTEETREELERYVEFDSGIGLNLSPTEETSFDGLVGSGSEPVDRERANAAVRHALIARLNSYRSEGLAGIAPYVREGGELVAPGRELEQILDQSDVLRRLFPRFMNMWDSYPKGRLPDATEAFYWIRTSVAERPMLVLAHQVGWHGGTSRLKGERLFYASHFFNAGHTIAVSTPTREGRLFSLIDRVWIDGYSGLSSVKHALGERMLRRRLVEQVEQRRVCISD